jgi:hypothetical protein
MATLGYTWPPVPPPVKTTLILFFNSLPILSPSSLSNMKTHYKPSA